MAGENIVRQDIVQISFETDMGSLNRMNNEIDQLRSSIAGIAGVNGAGDALGEAANQARRLGNALGDTEQSADQTRRQSERTRTSFEGLGRLTLQQLNSGLNKVSGHLTNIAKKAAGAAYRGLKKLAGISFKALAVGLGAAAVGVGTLTAQAVSAYADFEQLKGGVDTLFGAKGTQTVEEYAKLMGKSVNEVQGEYDKLIKAQNSVITNANNAYKTAGLSANDYMNTVTSFSASLINSLGGDTAKAAEMADMAIIDMADNANKMGTDISMIQNAYSSFARGQYLLLDNLKLGYAGTKGEMERLLEDAEKLKKAQGETVDYDINSYSDIIEAIHTIQENMGITGTTAKEAEKTITGSLNSMKAAWGNLLPALVQGGEHFDQCVDNLVSSVSTFAGNIMPVIKKALSGVGDLITELTPIIVKEIPSIAQSVLPPLLTAAITITQGLANAMPSIVNVLVAQIPNLITTLLPAFVSGVVQLVVGTSQAIIQYAPVLLEAAKTAFLSIVKIIYEGFTGKTMNPTMFNNLKTTIETVMLSIQKIIVGVIQFGQTMWNFLSPVFAYIGNLALTIFNGIANNISTILPIIAGLVAAFIVFKTVMVVVNAIAAIHGAVTSVMAAKEALATGATIAATAAQNGNNATILAAILLKGKEAAAWVASKAAMIASTVATKAAALGQMLLNGSLLACPITWIILGIIALIAVFVLLYNKCEWVRNAVNSIGDAIAWVGEKIGGFFEWCGEKLGFESKEAGKRSGEKLKEGFNEGSSGIDTSALNIGNTSGMNLTTGVQTGVSAFDLTSYGYSTANSYASGINSGKPTVTTAATNTANETERILAGISDTSMIGYGADLNLASGLNNSAYMPVGAASNVEMMTDNELQKLMNTSQYGTQAASNLAGGISTGSYATTSAAYGLATNTKNALSGVTADTAQIGSTAAANFSSGFTSGANSLTSAMGTMQNTVSTTMTGVTTDVSTNSLEATETMNTNMQNLVTGMSTKLTEAESNVKTSMTNIKTTVEGCDLSSSGANVVNGMIAGMNSRRGALIATAQSMASAVKNTINSALDIHSPSRVLFETGVNTAQGNIEGIKSKLPETRLAAQEMGEMSIPYSQRYTPSNSTTSTSRSTTVEHNTYNPEFHATFYTNGTDRDAKSKFKRWFDEAMTEFFASADRRYPRETEV